MNLATVGGKLTSEQDGYSRKSSIDIHPERRDYRLGSS